MNSILASILGITKLESARQRIFANSQTTIWKSTLSNFNISTKISGLHHLQKSLNKPTIIVCNHPHGLIDGFLIGYLLEDLLKKNDFKIVANSIVPKVIPELSPYLICIDNMSQSKITKAKLNSPALFKMIKHLKKKRPLVVFPAGQVSNLKIISLAGLFKNQDPTWSTSVNLLAKRTHAYVIPIYISGHNSLVFQVASLLGITAKRALAFRQFLNTRDKTIRIIIGPPQSPGQQQDLFKLTYSLRNIH